MTARGVRLASPVGVRINPRGITLIARITDGPASERGRSVHVVLGGQYRGLADQLRAAAAAIDEREAQRERDEGPRKMLPARSLADGDRHEYERSQYATATEEAADRVPCGICGNQRGATIHR